MKINALVFARYNSSRLAGKVLYELDGKKILSVCIEKLQMIKNVDTIVATSDQITDKPIWEWCESNNIQCFKGDLNDVAARTSACLTSFPCNGFLRVNADSPFLQTELIEQAISVYENDCELDLVTNILERTYPYGISVELIKSKTFLENQQDFSAYDCEHITNFFYRNSKRFKIHNITLEEEWIDIRQNRWVIDTQEDLANIKDILHQHPDLLTYNLNKLLSID